MNEIGALIVLSLISGGYLTLLLIFVILIIGSMMKPVEIPEEEQLQDYQGNRIFYGTWLVMSIISFLYFIS